MKILLALLLAQGVTTIDLPTEPPPIQVLQGHAAVVQLDPSACATPVTLFEKTWHCRPDNKLVLGIPMDAEPTEYRLSPSVVISVQKVPWISQHYPAVKSKPAPAQRMIEDIAAKVAAYHFHERPAWAAFHLHPPLTHPLPYSGGITEMFGVQRYYGTGDTPITHIGVDIVPAGTNHVFPVAPGVVVLAQSLWQEGNTIIIYHGDGVYSAYCHLAKMAVQEHDVAVPNRPIGLVGGSSEARTLGPHLHFVVRINGIPVDPLDALALLAFGLK